MNLSAVSAVECPPQLTALARATVGNVEHALWANTARYAQVSIVLAATAVTLTIVNRASSMALWHTMRTLLIGGAMCVLLVGQSGAVDIDLAAVQNSIRERVIRGSSLDAPGITGRDHRHVLERSYEPGRYVPIWFGSAGPNPALAAALAELVAAPTHGLVASDYDSDRLASEVQAIATGDGAPQRVARTDVAITQSMLRYLTDLHIGRVPPSAAGYRLNERSDGFDVVALLHQAVSTGRAHESIEAAEPSFAIYGRLKSSLAHYRDLDSLGLQPLPALPPGTTRVAPGDLYAGAHALGKRLQLLGDLSTDAALPESDRYGGAIVGGLRAFQARHGLEQDGILGPETLKELNVPLEERVRQLELAMERLRWLPRLAPGPVIAVNVPSYRLWAFNTPEVPEVPVLAMSVIVGRASPAMQTPIFIGDMRSVEFSPYWNVPRNIQKNELVPKLARDPTYLLRENMEIVGARLASSPTTTIDATTLTLLESGNLRIRQRPGAKNALGGVKFVLPNTMDIYLHGTPAQELFERTRRDFSHGCIRVADPLALTQFVLRDRPEWTVERMREAMAAGKPATVSLPIPIPVVIFYTTVIVGDDGRALFLPDVYGYDGKLEQALRARSRALRSALRADRSAVSAGAWRGSPPSHAPRIDVNEIGGRVVTYPAGAE